MDVKSGSRSSPVGRAIPVPRARRFLVTSQIKPSGFGDENEADQRSPWCWSESGYVWTGKFDLTTDTCGRGNF